MSLTLVHCSYHKCLTVYYHKVLAALCNRFFRWSGGYHHFASFYDRFVAGHAAYCVTSINNQFIDPDTLGDCRISRFIRDPRDLVVSGYSYHKRGAEPWCTVAAPSPERWRVVNGTIPRAMAGRAISYSDYLDELSIEDGLMAEIEFRAKHFQSMMEWPLSDPRIRLWRYEEIVGHEVEVMRELFEFYEMPWPRRYLGRALAGHYSLSSQMKRAARRGSKDRWHPSRHGRGGGSDWRRHFEHSVREFLEERHPGLLARYGYDR